MHEKGARHLVDPERLVRSAAMVYGDLLDSLYGRLSPTPVERVHVLADGETIDIGAGRTLATIYSPGHAKHHLALHDSESGILFAGDAVGVRLPDAGVLRPATPPADFDLDQAVTSLRKFRARNPTGRGPGPLRPAARAHGQCWRRRRRSCVNGPRWPRRPGGATATSPAPSTAEFAGALEGIDPENRNKLETLNGIHSNAAGLRRWLETTKGDAHGHPH